MGDQPSTLLRIGLGSANLNKLFTDPKFIERFGEACKTQPFTKRAASTLKKTVFPKKKDARRKAIESFSLCVALPKSVKDLCRELANDPSSLNVAVGWSNVHVSVQHLPSLHAAQEHLTELVQYVAVVDSLYSLAFYWHGLECGEKADRYSQIADRIHNIETEGSDSEKRKETLDICKKRWIDGWKIFTFCSDYLHDIGTVFHLPNDAKRFILTIGLPKENFQVLHQTLAERLINAGIQTEASSNGGRQILMAMQAYIVGASRLEMIDSTASSTLSQHSGVSQGCALATDTTSDTSHFRGEGVDDILAAAAILHGDESIWTATTIPDDQQNSSAGPLVESFEQSAAPGITSRQDQIAVESGQTSGIRCAMDLTGTGGFGRSWNSGMNALGHVQPVLGGTEPPPKRRCLGHQINATGPRGSDSMAYQGQHAHRVYDAMTDARNIESEFNDTDLAILGTTAKNYSQQLSETSGSSTTQSHLDAVSHPPVAPHSNEIGLVQQECSIPIPHDTASTFILRPPDPSEVQDSTMVTTDTNLRRSSLSDMEMVQAWPTEDDIRLIESVWNNPF